MVRFNTMAGHARKRQGTGLISFFGAFFWVCHSQPPFKNALYPCEPDTGTWLSVGAAILFFITALLSCCAPKPRPVIGIVAEYVKNDETDSCCILCEKKKVKDVEEEEETQEEEVEMVSPLDCVGFYCDISLLSHLPLYCLSISNQTPEEIVEEQEKISQELEDQKAKAALITALAAARHGKREEIERQLEVLSTYKEYLPEEEYEEKVNTLLHALPAPETYDRNTKTDVLVIPEEEEEEFGDLGDVEAGEEGEEGEDEPEKKSFGAKVTSGVTSTFSGMKKAVTRSKPQSPPSPTEEGVELDAGGAEAGGAEAGLEA